MIECIFGSLIGTALTILGSFYIIRYQFGIDMKHDMEKAFRDWAFYGVEYKVIRTNKNED